YLFHALVTAVEELKRRVHGSTMTHITKPVFNRVTIGVPPLETQKQIVAKLSAVQNYKKQLLEQKSKLKELFDSALAKSMTNK
ncbi:restriction endonuclease subunit S, partial [Patescibacteria group bacterium]|nr:restriction endonuclease subunit S [Patescibacteria group bacterium]